MSALHSPCAREASQPDPRPPLLRMCPARDLLLTALQGHAALQRFLYHTLIRRILQVFSCAFQNRPGPPLRPQPYSWAGNIIMVSLATSQASLASSAGGSSRLKDISE